MLCKILTSAVLAASALSFQLAFAQSATDTAPLPINGMIAAVKNEKLAFVSDNGRFVFRGSLYDTWSQKEITTLAEAERASNYIDLAKLRFRVDDLAPFTFGTGSKEVVIFTDPLCPSCHQLVQDLKQVKGYTFKILELSAMGPDSGKIVRSLHCAKDKSEALAVALGETKPRVVDQVGDDCDTSAIGKRIISAQMFGVKGVPFMIRNDGLVRHGYEKGSLEPWLAGAGQ
ncbi:DsbC family protein [Pseudomonas oryzihabitans]|uniref:Thiol:disulfide interchange protein n=1 Tax=Pseudomonas oryzihabitans TaxID=47885 RepID=A0A1G5PHZ6_9PSED|nr:DsbC family protein [Pseudomonas psychrotolerans]NMY91895.1 DsbC family protein [Pseudomonas psychrotolerans]NMY92766.1 DsbC family protein [Pseudomonas psychrotolerans]UUW74282.1 DsbC family protein [Pseudomonas psychrotolerans]SCZ48831.1 thiol:disulfide interchange protein DsbC [Pseudomonas psychrotolerans]